MWATNVLLKSGFGDDTVFLDRMARTHASGDQKRGPVHHHRATYLCDEAALPTD